MGKNKDKVACYALEVVNMDEQINAVLAKRCENKEYEGFLGVHIDPKDYSIVLIFDTAENRNKAYNKINHLDTNPNPNPEDMIVALVLPVCYVEKKFIEERRK